MSKGKQNEAGASEGARRATGEASASPTLVGTGRWSARRKVSVVIELLKGEALESLSRRHGVTAAKLSQWRDEFLAGGEARLKHSGDEDEDTRRLKPWRISPRTRPCSSRRFATWRPAALWAGGIAITRLRPPLTRARHPSVAGAALHRLRRRARRDHPPCEAKRGPKTRWTDAELTARIRTILAESPFHGEGHRKIWARLRAQGVRTSKRRTLVVMRAANLLGPARLPAPVVVRPHDGTIVTTSPNVMWGTDATVTVTLADGQVTIFGAIDHCTAECVGLMRRSTARASRRWNRCARASRIISVGWRPPPRPGSPFATTMAVST